MKIKRILLASVLATALLASSETMAELSANISLTSNYVSNGLTQTDDNPAFQAGLDYVNANGLYIGSWGSTVDNGIEVDVYAGYIKTVKNISYDIGYITYNYTDKTFSENSAEFYVGIIYKNYNLYYSVDDYSYIDFSADFKIKDIATLKLHYGLIEYDDTPGDYYDYSVTISKYFKKYELSLTYSAEEFYDNEEVFITISKSFDL